jgi:hypothetical protein
MGNICTVFGRKISRRMTVQIKKHTSFVIYFMLVSCAINSSTLKMEIYSSETSAEFYSTTFYYIPEGRTFTMNAVRTSTHAILILTFGGVICVSVD